MLVYVRSLVGSPASESMIAVHSSVVMASPTPTELSRVIPPNPMSCTSTPRTQLGSVYAAPVGGELPAQARLPRVDAERINFVFAPKIGQ